MVAPISPSEPRAGVALLLDASESRVLLRACPRGWRLPRVQLPDSAAWWEMSETIAAQVRSDLGLVGFVVRALEGRPRLGVAHPALGFVFEGYDLEWMRPPGTDWFGLDELSNLALVDEDDRELCELLLASSDAPPEPAWLRHGWVSSALSWAEAQLQDSPLSARDAPLKLVRQLRVSSLGSLLRVPLSHGSPPSGDRSGAQRPSVGYLKACGQLGLQEPQVHAWLARHYPALVAPVLACDEKRGLLLSADVGQSGRVDPHQVEWLLRELAEMQIGSARVLDELADMGCPDRSPTAMLAELPAIPDRMAALVAEIRPSEAVDRDEIVRLCERVRDALQELLHGEVPLALGHPNLTVHTVVSDGSDARITDWRGVIAHPFLSPGPLVEAMQVHGSASRVCGVYLDTFASFASEPRLTELYRHAQVARDLVCFLDLEARLPELRTRAERASALRAIRGLLQRSIDLSVPLAT